MLTFELMFMATVNNKSFEIEPLEDGFKIDGEILTWDLKKIDEDYFHIIYQNKSYNAEIVKADHQTKTFHVKINGRIYPVEVKDRFDLLLEKMGMNSAASGKVNNIKAPMPGLIIDMKVKD